MPLKNANKKRRELSICLKERHRDPMVSRYLDDSTFALLIFSSMLSLAQVFLPMSISPSKHLTTLFIVLLAYVALLTYFAATMPDEQFLPLFSETGFFETFSIVFWLVAALVVLLKASPLSRTHVAMALFFVLCAMREADWHKKFTSDGIFKLKYYTKSLAPLTEKIPAACVLLLFIGLLLYLLMCGFRYLRIAENRRKEAVWLFILGVGLFFSGKILDRSTSVLAESFDIIVSLHSKRYISAYEEGLEMVTPIFFGLAFFWPQRSITAPRRASA